MRSRKALAVLTCALAALAAIPAVAGAQGREVRRESFSLEVELPRRDGWRMNITADNHRQVYFNAYRGSIQVKYRVAGRASSNVVKADFGPLGRVDIELDLKAAPQVPLFQKERYSERRCHGRNPVKMSGRYRGMVEFNGDPSVAGVAANEGVASVKRTFRTVCQPRVEDKRLEPRIKMSFFAAQGHGDGRTTSFGAIRVQLNSEPLLGLVSGGVHERLGQVRVIRRAVELVDETGLDFEAKGDQGERVKVQPPRPFTGRASYLKTRNAPPSWTGDLEVRLPGTEAAALTGPQFDTTFCEVKDLTFADLIALDRVEGCFNRVRDLRLSGSPAGLLARLYGSGSQDLR